MTGRERRKILFIIASFVLVALLIWLLFFLKSGYHFKTPAQDFNNKPQFLPR